MVIYTSYGRNPFPRSDPQAVLTMDVPDAAGLAEYAKAVVDETFDAFAMDWRGENDDLDVNRTMELVATAVRGRHPELSPEAASAVAWMWGYSAWK